MNILDNYEVLSVIDSRSFGNSLKVFNKSTNKICEFYSIDCKELENEEYDLILSEINMLKDLKHENIVQCGEHVLNKETKTIFLVMEHFVDGNLLQLIEKCQMKNGYLEETYIWRIFYELCKALKHLDTINEFQQFCLCIKPENIAIDPQGNMKIGWVLKEKYKIHNCNKPGIWDIGYLIFQLISKNLKCCRKEIKQNPNYFCNSLVRNNYSNDLINVLSMVFKESLTFDMILQNPIFARNINFTNEYPKIVQDTKHKSGFTLNPNLSSTIVSNGSIMNIEKVDYGLSTPGLRYELFGLGKSGVSSKCRTISEPDLTIIENTMDIFNNDKDTSNLDIITKNVFDEMLERRLHAIRAHEFLLNQKETSLKMKEKELNEREKRITLLEKSILIHGETKKENILKQRNEMERKSKRMSKRYPKPKPDDTYCSIEPNETVIVPTIAKLNLPPRAMMKTYMGRSPKKFTKYNIEKAPAFRSNIRSISNKTNDNSVKSGESNQRIKSILSMFKLQKSKKLDNPMSVSAAPSFTAETVIDQEQQPVIMHKWTIENKKAAFEMLAAMKTIDETKSTDNNRYPGAHQTHRRRQSLPRHRTKHQQNYNYGF